MLFRIALTVAGSLAITVASAQAGCKNCQANAPVSLAPVPMGTYSAPVVGSSMYRYGDPFVSGHGIGVSSYGMGYGHYGTPFDGMHPFRGYRPDHMPYASGHIKRVPAPPGTIGNTYQLPSAPVPAEMHPRAAVLKVLADGAEEVELMSTNPMRTEDEVTGYQDPDTGVWVFKTDPLIPGNSQIYRVRAKYGQPGDHKDRWVRLIMGRVTALTY